MRQRILAPTVCALMVFGVLATGADAGRFRRQVEAGQAETLPPAVAQPPAARPPVIQPPTNRVQVQPPAARPPLRTRRLFVPTPAAAAGYQSPVPYAAPPAVPHCPTCVKWRVRHHSHPRHRKTCFTCQPTVNVVLQVAVPCACCPVDVPVCLPACCTDVPKVTCKRGLLGRYVVEYCWSCDFRLKMIFTKRGDVVVHSFGL